VNWVNSDCVNVPDAAAAKKSTMGNRFMMGLDNKTPLPVIYSIEGTVMDNKDKYKMRNYSKTSIIVAPYSESFYATGDDQLFYVETSAFWEMSGRSLVSDVNRFHNRFSAKKTTSGNAGLVKIKSERDFKNSDRDRPYGSDGKFFFFYNHKDARATNWTVRYKPWNEVEAGCGYYGGAWRDNHMDGGDFNGTMHDDWFNPNQW
jgi:hypothetical protein